MDYTALSPEEVVIACLETRDERAWTEFVRRFHPLISRVVLRIARQWGEKSTEAIDDLIQETYLKLCAEGSKLSHRFTSSHQDAIFGYIKVFTANLVHDHFKAARSQKRGGNARTESFECDGVETRPVAVSETQTIDRQVLIGEIDGCLRRMEGSESAERDRRIFWLYYRVGLSASGIAALPAIGLTTKGVESTIFRLTRYVRDQLVARRVELSRDKRMKEGIRPAESL